jgi:hypothetical protein
MRSRGTVRVPFTPLLPPPFPAPAGNGASGETAALRHLANAAKMIESNPGLMQLRMLQTLGGSSGNTLVLGLPAQTAAIPLKSGRPQSKEIPPQPPEEF